MAPQVSNEQIMYHWFVKMLDVTKPGGTVQTTLSAPLDRKQIERQLGRIAKHPNYQGQRIVLYDRQSTMVQLVDGVVL